MANIPTFLYDKLIQQYGEELTRKIIDGYKNKRTTTLRVNTLKTTVENVQQTLQARGIEFEEVNWNKEALIIKNANENAIRKLEIYDRGEIYLQSLSSMLPAIVLNPREDENILDMAAAPGGKTTQMAALSENKSMITACEKNKIRADRLRYNIEKQGATRVNIMLEDARNLNDLFSFDKILLDAPCSGSGTLNLADEKVFKYFTDELVQRSVKTQAQLLDKAIKILKKGHEMVYSTCSILQEENENNLQRILKNKGLEIVPIDESQFKGVTLLPSRIKGTICVCPDELYEGFFIAKIKRM